jgi:hypothetical protein
MIDLKPYKINCVKIRKTVDLKNLFRNQKKAGDI